MKHLILTTAAASLLIHATAFAQGSLSPTGAPAPTMKTLQQIWDKIGELQTTVNTQQNQINVLQTSLTEQSVLLQLIGTGDGRGLPWISTTVDSSGDVGEYTSLAYSASGYPAISYYAPGSNSLKYTAFNGTSWTTTTVDSSNDVGRYSSLAFKADGNPVIAYYNTTSTALKYAYFDGAAWNLETVDGTGSVGTFCSLAISPSDTSYISYYDATNQQLKIANRLGGLGWTKTVVDNNPTDVGKYSSLKFTPAGQPAIAYLDDTVNYLRYAEYDGSTWTKTSVATTVIGHISLAFNPAGQPTIAYGDTSFALKLAKYSGSGWSTSTVETSPVAQNVSLYYSHAGQPTISCYYGGPSDLYLYSYDGSAWHEEAVDSVGIVGQFSSLKYTPQGLPSISYYDSTNGDLKFTVKGRFITK